VHVEDIARAFIAVLKTPADVVAGQAYNVGRTDENYMVGDIAKMVAETVPQGEVTFEPDAGPDKSSYRVDTDNFRATFGPGVIRWRLVNGISQLNDALSQCCPSPEEFEGPRFARLAHLNWLLSTGAADDSLRWAVDSETRAGMM